MSHDGIGGHTFCWGGELGTADIFGGATTPFGLDLLGVGCLLLVFVFGFNTAAWAAIRSSMVLSSCLGVVGTYIILRLGRNTRPDASGRIDWVEFVIPGVCVPFNVPSV